MLQHFRRYFRKTNQDVSSEFGLVLDWEFHQSNGWASACMSFLVDAIITEFDPVIISSQRQYDTAKSQLRFIVSFEPGWAAPRLNYSRLTDGCKVVIYSDPHYQPEERHKYFDDNGFNYVLSLYQSPFFKHFKGFPEDKFIHFPWAVPDQFVTSGGLHVRSDEVMIFGGSKSAAYDIRNWCRRQNGVTEFNFSGVENKQLKDEEYYHWLQGFDAVIAAGSSDPQFDLVTPKYFEIAGAGALLIGQKCADLPALGFNEDNSLLFTKTDFVEKLSEYRKRPENFLLLREKGRNLIRSRHMVSHRVKKIGELFDAC